LVTQLCTLILCRDGPARMAFCLCAAVPERARRRVGWTMREAGPLSLCAQAGAPRHTSASRRNEATPISRLGSELDAQLAAWQRRQDNDTPKGFQDEVAGPPAVPAGPSCRKAVFKYPANADFVNATCMGLDTTVRVCAENDDAAQKAADVSGPWPANMSSVHATASASSRFCARDLQSALSHGTLSWCVLNHRFCGTGNDCTHQDLARLRGVFLGILPLHHRASKVAATGIQFKTHLGTQSKCSFTDGRARWQEPKYDMVMDGCASRVHESSTGNLETPQMASDALRNYCDPHPHLSECLSPVVCCHMSALPFFPLCIMLAQAEG